MPPKFIIVFFLFFAMLLQAQDNTVGLLDYKPDKIAKGYTLIFPRNQPDVFLLNNCGEIVHTWENEPIYVPNNSVYLLPNGDLLKCHKLDDLPNGGSLGAGGGGAYVERRSWENELLWQYEYNSEQGRIHHDIELLPNGNILMIAWDKVSYETAIAYGRLPETMTQGALFPDAIFEINPTTNERVWEWYVWDHIIQDIDENKPNYGVISAHPERIDVNYVVNNGLKDWLHINAIDYHPELDQIMLCVPYFDEIWIIDHSTTTEEAASNTGGIYGRGGDLLYRVGNPTAYQMGTANDHLLGFPHDTHWAFDFLETNDPNYGKMMVFNNKGNGDFSSMEHFHAPWNEETMTYEMENGVFLPTQFTNSITHPIPENFYSTGLSGLQFLPNGNLLAISGKQGDIIELTPENEIVWAYKVPFKNGLAVPQFTNLTTNDNLTFRATKYPPDYVAFAGKNMNAKGFIELEPQEDYCAHLFGMEIIENDDFSIAPNPVQNILEITWAVEGTFHIKLYDIFGRKQLDIMANQGYKQLNMSDLPNGHYFLLINDQVVRKVIKSSN